MEVSAVSSELVVDDESVDERSGSRSVINRAMTLLEAFTLARRTMTLSELARASGTPKTTTLRLATVLVEIGCLRREGNTYSLGERMALVALGSIESQLRVVARPWLQELHRSAGHNLHLAVLSGTDVVYLDKISARDSIPTPTAVGARMPAHLTGVGKALLAYRPREDREALFGSRLVRRTRHSLSDPIALERVMRDIRSSGVAHDESEAAEGLSCIAVPIWHLGAPLAALSLSFPANAPGMRRAEDALRVTAGRVERSMSSSGAQER